MPDPFLYERVYEYVLAEIRTANLRPGDRVPSEKDLAKRFGVSRITSKRALRMLADAGVVERHRGRGSFVAQDVHSINLVRDAGDLRRERTSGSGCLALVLPDASESYGLDLLCAIEERAAEHGYYLVVRRTRDSQEVEEHAIEALASGIAAGLIVFPVHGEFYNASLVRLVLDRSPLVLIDRYLRGIPACAVCTDNVAAAGALTTHLLDQGHHEIAFLSPPVENTSSIEERILGYETALRERGLPVRPERCFTGFQSTLPGAGSAAEVRADREALRAFLDREPDVTGFVACEYNIALLLRQVLDEGGHRDTESSMIVCFDSPRSRTSAGSFAHIRQDQQEMGRTAVDLLVTQLSGGEVSRRTVVPFTLVPPESATNSGEGRT